jgi:hypothetical protein
MYITFRQLVLAARPGLVSIRCSASCTLPITVGREVGAYSYLVHDRGLSMSSISMFVTSGYSLTAHFGEEEEEKLTFQKCFSFL